MLRWGKRTPGRLRVSPISLAFRVLFCVSSCASLVSPSTLYVQVGKALCARGHPREISWIYCGGTLYNFLMFSLGNPAFYAAVTAASRRITKDVLIALPVSKGCTDLLLTCPARRLGWRLPSLPSFWGVLIWLCLAQTRTQRGELQAMRQQTGPISWLWLLLPRQGNASVGLIFCYGPVQGQMV